LNPPPSFQAAFRLWLRLGFISFGGPAGQIALMHREVVERRGWVTDRDFAHALNFCMVLPGPEALQLAIYLGWRLHGSRGGVVAGLCFILPSVAILLALSFVYVSYGELPRVAAALLGLKATVVALILHAMLGLARRALVRGLHRLLALGAFLALAWLAAPFPLVLLVAATVGALAIRVGVPPGPAAPVPSHWPWRPLLAGLLLWVLPLGALLAAFGRDGLPTQVYGFFTQVALVTFGGAYAVLAYVQQHAVDSLGWLTASQAVTGLGLAESTPGPLVIVLQFVGFMAGWNDPGSMTPRAMATLTALAAAYATFLPSFIFILAGAPQVGRLGDMPRVAGALAGVTAAVVGVIASLGVSFGRAVLFPEGPAAPVWGGLAITLVAFVLLWRTRVDPLWVIFGGMAAGLMIQ
jgi:chromate transporter